MVVVNFLPKTKITFGGFYVLSGNRGGGAGQHFEEEYWCS
jgi:hypothetical protein